MPPLLPLPLAVLVVAGGAINPNPSVPESPLAAVIWLGSIVVLGLFGAVKVLWSTSKAKDAAIEGLNRELIDVSAKYLEQVIRVTNSSTEQSKENTQVLEAAMTMMHSLAGRPNLSSEQLAEVNFHLRRLRQAQATE